MNVNLPKEFPDDEKYAFEEQKRKNHHANIHLPLPLPTIKN